VPQPDYSAGCKETIFSKDQFRSWNHLSEGGKVHLYGYSLDVLSVSYDGSKCGNEGLNIADQQNAHSSSVAVKQVVDLYHKLFR
jgi:hypothetical protein